jgi:hypothetical protein
MSQKVLFNGAVLVRPGAATKVDASGFTNVLLSGVGVVGIVGEADGGAPNVLQTFLSAQAAIKYYRSGPLAEAANIAFQPGNDPRIGGGASLLVTVKVNQSTPSTLALAGTGGIGNVAGVNITQGGTAGTTNYTYGVVALLNGGFTKVTTNNTTTGAALLNATNYNIVGWTNLVGAQGYWIYRTVVGTGGSPSTTGFIGFAAAGATSFNDTGLFGDGTTPSQVNTTGASVFLTSKDYGVHTNLISAQISAGNTSNGRIITITFNDSGKITTELSPSVGDVAKFSLLYTGLGSASTATITTGPGAALTTVCTGATADNLNLLLANFASLADLCTAINATGKYTATPLIYNAGVFAPINLDPATAVSILTTPASFYATKFDLLQWINSNSQLVSAAPGGAAGPPTTMGGPAYLSGGYRGVTSNTNFTNAIALLGTIRVNQVVALASTDGAISENQGGTIVADSYTALAVAAAVQAHCDYYSSTIGKSEREGWVGLHLGKAAAISEANLFNDFNVVVVVQQINLPTAAPNFLVAGTPAGTFVNFPEWGTAVALASMRAGAPLGEPLTWKYVRAFGLLNTADWSVQNDAVTMLLNGITVLEFVQGKGIRVIRCLTTYTRDNNDAYTEESVVQAWKDIAFTWRSALENRYTGTRGLLSNVQTVVPYSKVILAALRDQGEIADSFVNGVVVPGFRNITADLSGDVLSVSGTVSPVEGINFILQTIYIVPAQISL